MGDVSNVSKTRAFLHARRGENEKGKEGWREVPQFTVAACLYVRNGPACLHRHRFCKW